MKNATLLRHSAADGTAEWWEGIRAKLKRRHSGEKLRWIDLASNGWICMVFSFLGLSDEFNLSLCKWWNSRRGCDD